MEPGDRRAAPRPNVLRRVVAGAWHVPAGITFIARTPSVRLPALAAAVVALLCLLAGAATGVYLLQYLENVVIPAPGAVGETLGVLVPFLLGLGSLGAGTWAGLALALLVSAPLLQPVSLAAERAVVGPEAAASGTGDVARALRSGALLILGTLPVLLLAMLPIVGPFLACLLAAFLLAVQQTDVPLARRGMDLRQRMAWHRRYTAESVGFGLASLVLLLVPCAGLLVTAALAAGGSFLVLEFETGLSVPDPSDTPVPDPPPAA